MAAVLEEWFGEVIASDVYPYGFGEVRDFLDTRAETPRARWIMTNPPFKDALEFAELALERADFGVCLLLRSQWSEGQTRFNRLFSKRRPTFIAQYVERVPMVKGCWDPGASKATAYSWFIWLKGAGGPTEFHWIKPGARAGLTLPSDLVRFARVAPAPLLDGGLS